MKFIRTFIVPLILIVVWGWLLRSVYMEAKNRAIDQLNSRQLVMAETAARGIESFFEHYTELLTELAKMSQIASLDEQGKELMRVVYLSHASEIRGITRVDASGRIVCTFPETPGAVGSDLSSQEHVQRLMRTHRPVVSDVFKSVQGFVTIAFHVPVFVKGVFQGSLAVLIPFDKLSHSYLEPIQIGKDGYAWVISREGTELYCPVPGHTGKSVFETCKEFPSILLMAREMMKGSEGTTSYLYDRVRGATVETVKKQAIYVPVHIGDTFWSIVVATPEAEAIEIIRGFKDRWLLIVGLLMLSTVLWSFQAIRAFNLLKEEERRKQTESALKESEKKYRELVESANSIIIRLDAEGRVTFFNEFAQKFFGYLEEEIIGQHVVGTIVPPTESSGRDLAVLLEEVVRNPDAYANNENENMRRNGERVWIAWTNKPILGEDGRIREVLCVGNDATDRKRAEQALKESEALLAESQKIAHLGSWSLDTSTKRLTWSDEAYRIFGLEPQEFDATYDAFLEAVHPEDREAVDTAYSNSLRQGRDAYEIEHRIVRKGTGEVRHIQEKCVHFHDAAGVVVRSIGMVQDITERKHSDAERTLLATVVEQAEENVLVTDARRTILYINPAFERSSGYRTEELKGRKLQALRSAQHDQVFYRNMKEILDRGEAWMGVIINKGKDGRDFEIEGTISPIRDASGSITHFVAVGRNMSRFRKLERELHQAQKMESVGRLAGGIAHDFNNMLGVIIGHVELALNRIDPESSAYNDMQEILKAANRSAKLTRQLLAFARKQTIRPEVLDINETVESMLQMVRRLIGEDVELIWEPCPDLWPVKVDPTQIDQILANLCINARDAIAGVGKVTIETGNVALDEDLCAGREGIIPGEYVLLSVSDNGCGMGKEVLDKLFEPFFTTKDAGKGTGLGLATVYGIVKQNNGFIDVESEMGRGASFRIYLPRIDVAVSAAPQPHTHKRDLKGNETILLVEDEESILELGRKILELHGYRVLAARSAADALDLAERHQDRIDLLITDVVMPGMNGKDLVEKLSALRVGFRTIFISGYTADIISDHGVLDEGVHFLQKPFSVKGMAEKVREILDM